MEQHPDSPAVATATSAAFDEASLNPPPRPENALVAEPRSAPPAASADPGDGAPPPGGYDPADYRWVPVRRTPRYDGWTEEKLRRFIEVLADTGQASLAAKAVGMSRESAYKLRRSAHGAAFARAWDAARAHAGSFLEDVAFERAIEGVKHNVYNEYGEVIRTKRVHNDRLLMFLLRHLKPERYARDALAQAPTPPDPVDAALRALEPPLPTPPAQLLGPEEMDDAMQLADIADGALPHFLSEQRPVPSPRQAEAKARAAQEARGEAAWEKVRQGGQLGKDEFADMCRFIDPTSRAEPLRKRR